MPFTVRASSYQYSYHGSDALAEHFIYQMVVKEERDKKIVRSKEDRVDAAAFAAVERPVADDRSRLRCTHCKKS